MEEISDKDLFEFVYNRLTEMGLAPYQQDVESIVEIFFDLLVDLGVAVEGEEP